ncbi:hypothetical protein CGZ90_19520 [Fictibacillus aquaticus]|uniref:Spore coat protein n=2 Tax=Fictibacillus aquaticus TaxID=2021314 RepID=A0A235F5T4_9BACL|nr:hypothetical protein CGZ90_19520 [Fictibacillus aquaticus]
MTGPSAVSPATAGTQCGYPPVSPAQVLPTQYMPAQYSPLKQNSEYKEQNYVVPMYHPSQTTQYNQTNVNYVHYFPHSKKQVNNVTQKHFCGGTYQQGY